MIINRRDASRVFSAALVARLALVAWAASRFPPAGDGIYYDAIAKRIAVGAGSTWLWPDGAVTYAFHYPIGYPALLGALYAAFGPHPVLGMLVNALAGAVTALAVYRLAIPFGSEKRATLAGLAVALHPALIPYTAALMTEGLTIALLALATLAAESATRGPRGLWGRVLVGLYLGAATLVRPQSIVLAPLLGLVALPAGAALGTRVRSAVGVTLVALACCAPWTVRNCVRVNQCALVSGNGGWNFLIGTQTSTGAWTPLDVPAECQTVWDEAGKDRCFRRAGQRWVQQHPREWLRRIPRKWAATFDYIGAGPWYLHDSNPFAFGITAKKVVGALETVACRIALFCALIAAAAMGGPRTGVRYGFSLVGILSVCTLHAWVGYAALAATLLALGVNALRKAPVLVAWVAMLIGTTLTTHAVFFGGGRYGLVVVPFVVAFAIAAFPLSVAPLTAVRALQFRKPAHSVHPCAQKDGPEVPAI